MKEQQVKCPVCGKGFIKNGNAQKFCSEKCRIRYSKIKSIADAEHEYTCKQCGKKFKWDRKKRFCSIECKEIASGKRKKLLGPSLEEVAARCKAEDLSYGQYVAKYGL